jgi:hypothetical protein
MKDRFHQWVNFETITAAVLVILIGVVINTVAQSGFTAARGTVTETASEAASQAPGHSDWSDQSDRSDQSDSYSLDKSP